jgi:hypothetical protein
MKMIRFLAVLFLALPGLAQSAPSAKGVLSVDEVQKLMPPSVYFNGQTATVQLRNSAAFRFADGKLVLAGVVDTSGYSSEQRDKYQFYLISDVPLQVAGKILPAGAYGCGFLPVPGFLVMDLGGNEVFRTASGTDAAMARPRPLQMVQGSSPNTFRLYVGRTYIEFHR